MPEFKAKGDSPEKLDMPSVRTSEDKFLSQHISRKTGVSLVNTETRRGREGYKLMRRTVRRGKFLSQEEKKAIKRKHLQMLKGCLRKYISMLIEMSSI